MYQLSYSDQISLGMIDPDDDTPIFGRCAGPSVPDAYGHGCGRFVANNGTICPRCLAETEAHWAEDIAAMARLDAEFDMQATAAEDAYWQSPEGQAEMAAHAAYIADCEASGPLEMPPAIPADDDDLPF